jgi:hypothetical protein
MRALLLRSLCLTRVVTDDDAGVEVAQVATIIERIQQALGSLPPTERDYVAKALLAYATGMVQRAVED